MTTNRETAGGRLWPLWGAAAGVLGYVGHLVSMANVTDDQRAAGLSVMTALDSTNYRVGVVSGMVAVFCLLVFAAGWRRWAASAAPASLSASVVPHPGAGHHHVRG